LSPNAGNQVGICPQLAAVRVGADQAGRVPVVTLGELDEGKGRPLVPCRSLRLRAADDAAARLSDRVRAIEAELEIPAEFPPGVLTAAQEAAANPKLPDLDRTDLPLVTLDPAGSRDLDQALHIERLGTGYRVFYAIADVAAFVEPDGPIDAEARKRGQTLYAPDHRVPLHPPALSEGAASLLPDQVRPALLWTIDLDPAGEGVRIEVVRARVRSQRQYDYEEAQREIDAGRAPEVLRLLREVGELRLRRERERGGVSLQLPEQEVVVAADGWSLNYRTVRPVEEWNAQISLLTGMGAAELMLYGEEGIVRTLPPAPDWALARLRRTAAGLHIEWDPDVDYPDFVRSLDPNTPHGAAMLHECASLLRGAGYVAFDGGVPEHIEHAAIAHEYAHVTAPLRRLADRYAGEIAVSLCAGTDVPDWVRAQIQGLPKLMQRSEALAKRYERAVLDMVEAGVLSDRVGEMFSGVVVDLDDHDKRRGRVVVRDPAVEAAVSADRKLPLGIEVSVRLVKADVDTREVAFELA
jgi:exoribonuclease R